MRPVTLMTHPQLLSLLLSLNKALKSYLPITMNIVVGKLYTFYNF